MSKTSDNNETDFNNSFEQKVSDKNVGFKVDNLKMSSEDTNSNRNPKSMFTVTESDIDGQVATDNNNLQNETIDGFDFDTPEEFMLYHSRTGNLKVVEKLVLLAKKNEIELDLNCKGKQKSNYGWSPLHLAAYFGHYSVCEELIKNNASVNIVNESGDTPLHKAAYTGRDDIVVLLVSSNADVFIINGDGLTPRELARKESVRRILLAAEEADLKRREERFLSCARNGDIDTMKAMLSDTNYPLKINCVDISGNTALHCAAYRGQKEVAVFLLKNGIDSSIKNNRGQLAAALAPNVQIKQLLHEVQPINAQIASLKTKTVSRFEGPLLKKGRFFGWRMIWAVLERGVFSFFGRRADASTGTRRKGFKYLESAICEPIDSDDQNFVIYFSDRSRALLSVPNSQMSAPVVDRQKWINAINDHIYYGTNFIKQGMRFDDSDDDELTDLMPRCSIQSMIQTANAHQSILEKHIRALLQLSEDINNAENQLNLNNSNISQQSSDLVNKYDTSANISRTLTSEFIDSTLPSLKFHLNLILESSNNATSALSQCLAVLTHQDDVRQLLLKQEQEKVRVLEDALHVLAREHHDLERSIVSNSANCYHSPPRTQSVCMSDTTDVDEFFDAFDDADDNTDKTLTQSSDELNSQSVNTMTADYMTPVSSLADLCPQNKDYIDGYPEYRLRLPSVMIPRDEVSLWSILKHCIGKELSKITFPVVFNEPLSFLQRMTEILEYAEHLNIADQSDDPIERMENVCAFIVSAYSSNWLRLNKPFNPLLGETFEYEIEDQGIKVVFEQVSHHPPVSAWYAESPHFILHGTICPKLKFWGKSIEIKPDGTLTLKLKSKPDVYTWKSVNCCIHNIIIGKLWFEQYGFMEVTNQTNGLKAQLNFKAAGWFGKDLHRFEGFISSDKEKLRFVYGKWSDYFKSVSVDDYEEYIKSNQRFRVPDRPATDSSNPSTPRKMMSKLNSLTRQLTGTDSNATDGDNNVGEQSPVPESSGLNGDLPKSDSSNSLHIPNSRLLWQVNPRPEESAQYYHFTLFSMSLNQFSDDLAKRLPQTDSRFRPDVRKLEDGDLESAAQEKNRLEEKQREVRRLRKKKREGWEPLWFNNEQNPYTKEDDWLFNGQYWNRDFNKCPDIY